MLHNIPIISHDICHKKQPLQTDYKISLHAKSLHMYRDCYWLVMDALYVKNLHCINAPGRRQAIIWTNVVVLLIGPLWTNLGGI